MKRRHWTDAEKQLLRELYPVTPTEEIAQRMNRGVRGIYAYAYLLKLEKSPEYLASPAAGRIAPDRPRGVAKRFPKGQLPWNTGKRFMAGGRSAETRFKKGERRGAANQNWVPVGTYRINSDGYLDRKVSDNGKGPRDWEGVHRLVWKAANGDIPPGYVVVFFPGMRTTVLEDITLDRLELVTRAELMRRNTAHRYGLEVQQAMSLLGRLRKTIERKAEERAA